MPGPFNGGGKMGRNSTQSGAGGPAGTGGASRGGSASGTKSQRDKLRGTLFDLNNKALNPINQGLKSLPGLVKGKITEGGQNKKPGEDNIAASQALISSKPLTDVEKAVIEARRQRNELSTGVQIGSAIAPSIIGGGLTLGNFMGKKAEDDAMANPDRFRGNPVTGEVQSVRGPLTANRALDLPSNKKNTSNASADEETKKKKKEQLPTLLGASANPLGTFSNPFMIT